jgi:iron only hydrogenase large subunit-like protein
MIGEREVRVAVVHGTKKVREVVEAVLSGDKSFDLIEVMACPGGCVGGGGEPKTSAVDADVIRKRIDAIYCTCLTHLPHHTLMMAAATLRSDR